MWYVAAMIILAVALLVDTVQILMLHGKTIHFNFWISFLTVTGAGVFGVLPIIFMFLASHAEHRVLDLVVSLALISINVMGVLVNYGRKKKVAGWYALLIAYANVLVLGIAFNLYLAI